MGNLIKNTHHIALRCDSYEMLQTAIGFYQNVLGMELVRTWGEGADAGAMLSTGNSLMELFAAGKNAEKGGTINHFALGTDDVDACVEAVRKAGYEITMEPNDIVIGSEPPFPARIAFCIGPVGEEIEFFCEK